MYFEEIQIQNFKKFMNKACFSLNLHFYSVCCRTVWILLSECTLSSWHDSLKNKPWEHSLALHKTYISLSPYKLDTSLTWLCICVYTLNVVISFGSHTHSNTNRKWPFYCVELDGDWTDMNPKCVLPPRRWSWNHTIL